MRKYFIRYPIVILLVFQAAITNAGQLSSSLERYKEEVRQALGSSTDKSIQSYLKECLDAASILDGLEVEDPRALKDIHKFKERRLGAQDTLESSMFEDSSIQAENKAYNSYLFPYLKAEYISFVAVQNQLFERKYFKSETAENANFLEAYINSKMSLTKANIDATLDTPNLGVSPWEAIFRVEPTVVFVDGAHPAVVGAAGLSYTFFPDIDHTKMPISFQDSFISEQIKKLGGRIGIGVGQIDDETRLLMGAGVQIRAIALWGLYEPGRKVTMLGISASDLSKLKKVIGWFD